MRRRTENFSMRRRHFALKNSYSPSNANKLYYPNNSNIAAYSNVFPHRKGGNAAGVIAPVREAAARSEA